MDWLNSFEGMAGPGEGDGEGDSPANRRCLGVVPEVVFCGSLALVGDGVEGREPSDWEKPRHLGRICGVLVNDFNELPSMGQR